MYQEYLLYLVKAGKKKQSGLKGFSIVMEITYRGFLGSRKVREGYASYTCKGLNMACLIVNVLRTIRLRF